MSQNGFHEQLGIYSKQNNGVEANRVLMQELARILVRHRKDFVDLLNESGIKADVSMTDTVLVNKFIDNIHNNSKLRIGAAFLANIHNKSMGFDGEKEVNDGYVKHCYYLMSSHFDANQYDDIVDSEGYYNAEGGDPVSAIAKAAQEGFKFGSKITSGQQQKKYGGQQLLSKKLDAKNQMVQSIIAQRQYDAMAKQKRQEQFQKTLRVSLIVVGGIALVGFGIWMYRRKNKKGDA